MNKRLVKVQNRETMGDNVRRLIDVLARPDEFMVMLRDYVGLGRRRRRLTPILDLADLRYFLETRASHVAQTSLYGYLRTRAGMRYPELFHDDAFVVSINIAKWQMWLACLSDLAVYTGGLIVGRATYAERPVAAAMRKLVDEILADTGVPADAGPDFAASAEAVRERIAQCNWSRVTDDEGAFEESPEALVRWAPIVDELKEFDAPIVINSVRFRWQEVRRDLRETLNVEALLGEPPAEGT